MVIRRSSRFLARTTCVLLVAALGAALAQPSHDVDSAPVIGTIQAVDPAARELRLITGIGHSLRLTIFHAPASCRFELAGTAARMEELRRGLVVAVRHRKVAGRYEAESVETLAARDDRSRR